MYLQVDIRVWVPPGRQLVLSSNDHAIPAPIPHQSSALFWGNTKNFYLILFICEYVLPTIFYLAKMTLLFLCFTLDHSKNYITYTDL